MISYGLTPPPPTMPFRMTDPSMHVAARSRSQPMTGAVSRPSTRYHLETSHSGWLSEVTAASVRAFSSTDAAAEGGAAPLSAEAALADED